MTEPEQPGRPADATTPAAETRAETVTPAAGKPQPEAGAAAAKKSAAAGTPAARSRARRTVLAVLAIVSAAIVVFAFYLGPSGVYQTFVGGDEFDPQQMSLGARLEWRLASADHGIIAAAV